MYNNDQVVDGGVMDSVAMTVEMVLHGGGWNVLGVIVVIGGVLCEWLW